MNDDNKRIKNKHQQQIIETSKLSSKSLEKINKNKSRSSICRRCDVQPTTCTYFLWKICAEYITAMYQQNEVR